MEIDGREIDLKDVLKQLKQILLANRERSIAVDVLVNTMADAKKISAFVAMSGCAPEIDKIDSFYIIRIRGNVCCA